MVPLLTVNCNLKTCSTLLQLEATSDTSLKMHLQMQEWSDCSKTVGNRTLSSWLIALCFVHSYRLTRRFCFCLSCQSQLFQSLSSRLPHSLLTSAVVSRQSNRCSSEVIASLRGVPPPLSFPSRRAALQLQALLPLVVVRIFFVAADLSRIAYIAVVAFVVVFSVASFRFHSVAIGRHVPTEPNGV